MVVIEDKGIIKFFNGKKRLTLREGFARLDELYCNEPIENKKVIDRLKEAYWESANETDKKTVL